MIRYTLCDVLVDAIMQIGSSQRLVILEIHVLNFMLDSSYFHDIMQIKLIYFRV